MPQQIAVPEGIVTVEELVKLTAREPRCTAQKPAAKRTRRAPANIKVECTHLVSLPGPNGTRYHILFNPTPKTVEAVRKWADKGVARGITVDDRAGLFSRDTRMRVLNIVHDYGTLVITTDR